MLTSYASHFTHASCLVRHTASASDFSSSDGCAGAAAFIFVGGAVAACFFNVGPVLPCAGADGAEVPLLFCAAAVIFSAPSPAAAFSGATTCSAAEMPFCAHRQEAK